MGIHLYFVHLHYIKSILNSTKQWNVKIHLPLAPIKIYDYYPHHLSLSINTRIRSWRLKKNYSVFLSFIGTHKVIYNFGYTMKKKLGPMCRQLFKDLGAWKRWAGWSFFLHIRTFKIKFGHTVNSSQKMLLSDYDHWLHTLYFYNNEPPKNKHFLILLSSLARNSQKLRLKRYFEILWVLFKKISVF